MHARTILYILDYDFRIHHMLLWCVYCGETVNHTFINFAVIPDFLFYSCCCLYNPRTLRLRWRAGPMRRLSPPVPVSRWRRRRRAGRVQERAPDTGGGRLV